MTRVGGCGVRLMGNKMGEGMKRERSTFDVQVCDQLVPLLWGEHGWLRANRSDRFPVLLGGHVIASGKKERSGEPISTSFPRTTPCPPNTATPSSSLAAAVSSAVTS